MSGWAGDQTPQEYPADRQFLARMPVASPAASSRVRKPRGKPGCSECDLGETGVCGRHSYDPVKSLGITPGVVAVQARDARLEQTWMPVL